MSDLPPPARARRMPKDRVPLTASDPLAIEEDLRRPAVGDFFAEHKAVVDERRQHLARLGMDERHVQALRMPEHEDKPLRVNGAPATTPVTADGDTQPEDLASEHAPKKLRKDAPMRGDLEE